MEYPVSNTLQTGTGAMKSHILLRGDAGRVALHELSNDQNITIGYSVSWVYPSLFEGAGRRNVTGAFRCHERGVASQCAELVVQLLQDRHILRLQRDDAMRRELPRRVL